jgi:hypothetical protein
VTFLDLLRHLDWREELLGVLLVLAETTFVYLICGLLLSANEPGSPVLAAWIIAVVMVTAHLVPRLLDEWRIWSPQYEIIMLSAVVVTLLIAIKSGCFPDIALWDIDWLRQTGRAIALLPNDAARPVWAMVVLTAYAWWRGRTRADPSVDSSYVMLRNGSATMALLIIVILAAADPSDQIRGRLSIATIMFFIWALAAVGVSRLRLEGFRTSAPLGPRWLATFVGPILAVVVVAIIGAGIFSRQFLDTVLWMLTPVFFVLDLVFQAFVLFMAVIAYIILTPLFWLIGDHQSQIISPPATPALSEDRSNQITNTPFHVPDPLRYLIAAIILFGIASLLTRFLFRRRRRDRQSTTEERESVLDWSDLFGSLGARLRGLLRRDKTQDDPLAHLRHDPRWQYTLAIREVYLRLQQRGQAIGRPRLPYETADEYRPDVSQRLGAAHPTGEAVATLTDRYRTARYSGEPAGPADAAAAEDAWKVVERTSGDAYPG